MTIFLPGDHILHDGHPAIVLCGHPDGRLYIRPEHGASDLLVPEATCTPVDASSSEPLQSP